MALKANLLGRLNFLKDNPAKASLVVCCLYPVAVAKLSLKLGSELEPGAKVISNTFEIPAWMDANAGPEPGGCLCPQVFHYEITSVISGIQQFIDTLPVMIV